MIALDHVQPHRMTVVNHFQKNRTQRFKLIDVITIRIRKTAVRFTIFAAFQPHHFRLGTHSKIHLVLILELLMESFQIAATIGRQRLAWIFSFFTIAETNTEDTSHALIPRQLTKRFRIRNADQFHRLGAITDVVPIAIDEKIGG